MKAILKNDWMSDNLHDRLEIKFSDLNPNLDFEVKFNPYTFEQVEFHKAADQACREISEKYENLFLAYSGGLDSEYVLRAFHRNGIKVTPIIVCCGNEFENEYAYETCEELGIDYINVDVTEDVFFEWYARHIGVTLKGIGVHSTQKLFAAEVAKSKNGALVLGLNVLGDGDDIIDDVAIMCEWDFYTNTLYEGVDIVPFFLYSQELTYSMIPDEQEIGNKWSNYKAKLYNLPRRRKLYPAYSNELEYRINMIKRVIPEHKIVCSWSRQDFFNIFNDFKR